MQFTEQQKRIARAKAGVYRRRRKIIPQPCEVCGTREKVEAHHDDYSKALLVRWLCPAHHTEHHVKARGIADRCARCGVEAPSVTERRSGYCHACKAGYMREYRKTHQMNEEQKRKDAARSTVGVYLRRGKIAKSPCPCCGSADVKARIFDYAEPLRSLAWLCPVAHAISVRTGSMPAMQRAA